MGSDIEYAEGRLEFNSWYSWFYKSKERHIKQHNVNNIKSTYKLTIRILIIGFILFIYFGSVNKSLLYLTLSTCIKHTLAYKHMNARNAWNLNLKRLVSRVEINL